MLFFFNHGHPSTQAIEKEIKDMNQMEENIPYLKCLGPHFVVFSYTLLSGRAPLPSEMLKALERLRVAQSVF